MSLRVLYIYDGDWPKAATRVRKQTMALAEAGHHVRLLCRNATRGPRVDREPWMEIRRLPEFPGALNPLLNFPLFFSPVWLGAIWSEARTLQADVLVVEDLPMAPAAVALGKLLGTPVVYDMGEVYPEFLRGLHVDSEPSLVDRVLRNPTIAGWIESFVLRHADHTTLVSEESRTRALGRGLSEDAVSIVGNTPEDPASLTASTHCPPSLSGLEHRPIALFVGILIHDRGLFELVRAFPRVLERVPSALLVIVGDGREATALRKEISDLGLDEHVVMAGWQQHATLPAFYQRSRVGMLPFKPGGQIDFTLANKLFDYLGAGLPVVATDVPPMRRVVTEADVGVLIDGPTPESVAGGIVDMLTIDDDEWRAMAERGRKLVSEEYNWAEDAARFVRAVEGVSGTGLPSERSA